VHLNIIYIYIYIRYPSWCHFIWLFYLNNSTCFGHSSSILRSSYTVWSAVVYAKCVVGIRWLVWCGPSSHSTVWVETLCLCFSPALYSRYVSPQDTSQSRPFHLRQNRVRCDYRPTGHSAMEPYIGTKSYLFRVGAPLKYTESTFWRQSGVRGGGAPLLLSFSLQTFIAPPGGPPLACGSCRNKILLLVAMETKG
jgi:hypothetical protein